MSAEQKNMDQYLGRGWTAKFPEKFTKEEQKPGIIKRALEKVIVSFKKKK